jgi:hypothetical protein
MANQEKREPTFIEQAFAIIEENYSIEGAKDQHGMTIADHKLLCRVLNAHECYIDEKVIGKFIDEIAEHYKPIMKGIESLASDLEYIAGDIKEIQNWQVKIDERIGEEELKSLSFTKKIDILEKQVKVLKPELVEKFIGVMEKMIETQKPTNIAKRIATAVIISIAVITIAAYLFLPLYHRKVLENPDGTPKTERKK